MEDKRTIHSRIIEICQMEIEDSKKINKLQNVINTFIASKPFVIYPSKPQEIENAFVLEHFSAFSVMGSGFYIIGFEEDTYNIVGISEKKFADIENHLVNAKNNGDVKIINAVSEDVEIKDKYKVQKIHVKDDLYFYIIIFLCGDCILHVKENDGGFVCYKNMNDSVVPIRSSDELQKIMKDKTDGLRLRIRLQNDFNEIVNRVYNAYILCKLYIDDSDKFIKIISNTNNLNIFTLGEYTYVIPKNCYLSHIQKIQKKINIDRDNHWPYSLIYKYRIDDPTKTPIYIISLCELKDIFIKYSEKLSYELGIYISFNENNFKTEKYFIIEYLENYFNKNTKYLCNINDEHLNYLFGYLNLDKYKISYTKYYNNSEFKLTINDYKFRLFQNPSNELYINYDNNLEKFDVNAFLHEIRD